MGFVLVFNQLVVVLFLFKRAAMQISPGNQGTHRICLQLDVEFDVAFEILEQAKRQGNDDIESTHLSSITKLSETKLFWLMSL